LKTSVVISVFSLAVVLLFAGVFFGPRTFLDANPYHFDPWRSYAQEGDTDNPTYRTDALFAYLPRTVELTRSIRAGRIPLWNPYILGGMPFFADPQSRVAYPIALLLVAVDPVDAMGYDVALHLVIAMVGMYLFLRSIKVNLWGSVLGGFAFGFSSFFYVRLGHPTFIASAALVPFFFYGLEKARRSGPAGTVMLAGFLALGYLAGFPQVFLFGVGALVFYALYTSLDTDPSARKPGTRRTIEILLAAGLLSMLLVAVQLVPFLEFLRNSTGLGVDIDKMTGVYLASPVLLLRSFFPSLFGNPIEGTDWSGLTREFTHTYNPEFAVYCGLGTLLAAAAAVALIKTNRHVRFFVILLALTIGLATSRLLLDIGYAVVPLIDISKISRIAVVSCFALSALGGIGLSAVTDNPDPSERRRLIFAAVALAVGVLAVGLWIDASGRGFIEKYLARAKDLPEEYWERTHQEARSAGLRHWAEGTGGDWVAYERRQIRTGFVFLLPAAGLLVLLAGSKKTSGSLKTGLTLAFVSLVAIDAGLTTKSNFISQVSSRVFETEGIKLLEQGVGNAGMWRVRSARYQYEDIKAFPPNTNMLFSIHSLNGTSTLWPTGYQQLYDGFGGTRPLSKRWDKRPAAGVFEALASDFACVRYSVANNRGLPALFPPLMRLVAARAGIPSRVRVMQIGNDARLAVWQRPGETLNLAIDLPEVQALEFTVGFDPQAYRSGDSITVWLSWDQHGEEYRFMRSFDLGSDGGRWHPFRMDLSRARGGRARVRMGCEMSGQGRHAPVVVAWGGLDLVTGDCGVRTVDGGYEISVDGNMEYIVVEVTSPAAEIALDIRSAAGGKVRWLAFPTHMPVRRLCLDIREREGDRMTLKSDSAFTLLDCYAVFMDAGCPDYELIYDKDMYIYENLAAVRKGVCLDPDFVGAPVGPKGELRVSALGEIGEAECGRCEIVDYRPEEVVLRVVADSDCYLLFQDVWYPGWKAYVDGIGTDIIRTDIGMRAIAMPEGTHRVEMRYTPRSIKLGLALTCLGIILCVGYATRRRVPSARPTG
jgi:hypothetical protein